MKADKTKKGVGTNCLYHIREASRIAFVADKDNRPHPRICKEPLRAVHTKDAVPLPIIFATWKFCENFTNEDNFNYTLPSTMERRCKGIKSF